MREALMTDMTEGELVRVDQLRTQGLRVPMRRWLITGTRHGRADVWRELDRMARLDGKPYELVCGESRGVDQQAQGWAKENEVPCKVFVALWRKHGRAAGPLRNQAMVDHCDQGDLCLAFPSHDSKGTHDCYERAVVGGLQGVMIPPKEPVR